MRFLGTAALLAALMASPLAAQTPPTDDQIIDTLLAENPLTWDNAVWLVARSSGLVDEGLTPAQASERAAIAGWGDKPAGTGTAVTLAQYSYLLVKALKIPGGLFYSLAPGPRYAYRELVFRKLVPGTLQPDSTLSGENALRYLQNAQKWKEPQS